MLYEKFETDISYDNLTTVLSNVTERSCLLGGWAVYLTVNDGYKSLNNMNYHGSRDTDLGFHFSGNESLDDIVGSGLNQTVIALKNLGYRSSGFRMFQHYRRETRKLLSPDGSRKIPMYDLFVLYVDLMTDRQPLGITKALGITPVVEKMLVPVF